MNSTSSHDPSVANVFSQAVMSELEDAIAKTRHCLSQLSEDQLWWRPTESMNSIANLILHLRGNVRQWIISGVGGSPDTRNRPQEFAHRDRIPTEHLLEMLDEVSADVRRTLDELPADELSKSRSIQGYDVSGMLAVIHSIAHFRGHVQEIVHMTRIQLGDDYEFEFVPGPHQNGGAA